MADQTFIFDISSLADIDSLAKYTLRTDRGGEISANLAILSGTFSGGINAIATGNNSFAYGNNVSAIAGNSIAHGYSSNAGCIGYFIADKSDDDDKYWLNTVDGIEEGMIYSVYYYPGDDLTNAFGNRDCIGKVTAVDRVQKTITVTNMWKGTVNVLTASYLWFPFENLQGGDAIIGNSAAAIGYECVATQIGAFACGADTSAVGKYAHTEGTGTIAVYSAHAEGKETSAFGQGSHAEGHYTVAGGTNKNYCHAEGRWAEALGYASHAAGQNCYVSSDYAWGWSWDPNHSSNHAYVVSGDERIGSFNINPQNGINGFYIGDKSLNQHIELGLTNCLDKRTGGIISGDVETISSLAVGQNILQGNSLTSGVGISGTLEETRIDNVQMSGENCIALNKSSAFGIQSFAANQSKAYSKNSAAFGNSTAYGSYSFAHGASSNAYGYASHVEGRETQTGLSDYIGCSSNLTAYGCDAHAEGDHTKAIGNFSHAEGSYTETYDTYSHAEGIQTKVLSGNSGHAEGQWTEVSANYAHAEGTYAKAYGEGSHAEGSQTYTEGAKSHAEGANTSAFGFASHVEGDQTYAEGQKSHAEGGETSAFGFCAHAEGRSSIARARYSHAEGATAEILENDEYSFVWSGKFNKNNYYTSNGPGTFSINPQNGINGFYIGPKTLSSYIIDASSESIDEINDEIDLIKDNVAEVSAASHILDEDIICNHVYVATNSGYINRITGEATFRDEASYKYTDLIPLDDVIEITASYTVRWTVAGWAIYNEDSSEFVTGGYNLDNPDTKYTADKEVITKQQLLELLPTAKFIRFGSISLSFDNTNTSYFNVKFAAKKNSKEVIDSINDKISIVAEATTTNVKTALDVNINDNTLLYRNTGLTTSYSNSITTDFIDVDQLPRQLKMSGTAQWSSCMYCLYDENQNFLVGCGYNVDAPNTKYTANNELVDIYQLKKTYPQFKYIRFGSLSKSLFKLSKNEVCSQNVLNKKTYVIAGDSFTYDTTSIRSYGNIIAERNGMNAINIGVSGSYMHSNTTSDAKSFAQTILPNSLDLVAKADYMTICYGLNETSLTIGSKEDNSLTTMWGAWNVALSSIFEANPAIKLGIIIPDAWTTQNMHDTLSAIAQWWGIPCLDLKDGPTAMIDGRLNSSTINPYVVEKRNSVFKVADDNGHPTQKAQEFRSTIVENFLRSM